MYKKGLIKTVIVIVIALIILGYFGFNVKDIIDGPTVQANLHTALNIVSKIWNNYLAGPVLAVVKWIWSIAQSIVAGLGVK